MEAMVVSLTPSVLSGSSGGVIDVFALSSILPALLSDCQTGPGSAGSAAHCYMDPNMLTFNYCNDA